jgi:hypothetical protein
MARSLALAVVVKGGRINRALSQPTFKFQSLAAGYRYEQLHARQPWGRRYSRSVAGVSLAKAGRRV